MQLKMFNIFVSFFKLLKTRKKYLFDMKRKLEYSALPWLFVKVIVTKTVYLHWIFNCDLANCTWNYIFWLPVSPMGLLPKCSQLYLTYIFKYISEEFNYLDIKLKPSKRLT